MVTYYRYRVTRPARNSKLDCGGFSYGPFPSPSVRCHRIFSGTLVVSLFSPTAQTGLTSADMYNVYRPSELVTRRS